MTSCSVTRSDRPVRRLWISDARRADSTRASRLRSLLRDAAIYALETVLSMKIWEDEKVGQAKYRSWFSSWVRSVLTTFAGGMVRAGGIERETEATPAEELSCK